MSQYLNLKFILALVTLGVASWLVWVKAIESVGYVTIVVATVGGFIAGDVYEKKAASMSPATAK